MRSVLFAALMTLALAVGLTAQTQPLLQLQGLPYFGGSMKLHLTGTVGQPALLAYGLNPLTTPIQTGKGPWFIGTMINLIALGNIPTGGRIDLVFTMPPLMPALAGIPIVMQGYVPLQLSNPATLSLDEAYLQPGTSLVVSSPHPSVGANFGDTFAMGDLNADGSRDLVVGAWFEDYAGVDKAGQVVILWGPSYQSWTDLVPAAPVAFGLFGASVVVDDFTEDGVVDLLVAETAGDPPLPNTPARLHIFAGGTGFVPLPAMTIDSTSTLGLPNTIFGRVVAVGDYNGDGHRDIAVGNINEQVGGFQVAGRIDVYWGPDYGSLLVIENPTPAASDGFGTFLATGDVTGDGVDDLIEGSGRDDVGGVVNLGSVHVYAGPTLGLYKTLANPLPEGFNSRFGEEVHGADLNADGADEVVTVDLKNHVYVFWSPSLSSYTVISKPEALNTVSDNSVSFGYFVTTGDINGDAAPDILISDVFEGAMGGCAFGKEGTLFAALGPYWSTFHVLHNPMPACGDNFSWRVTTGDLNADGVLDVLTASPTSDATGNQNAGQVRILLGASDG